VSDQSTLIEAATLDDLVSEIAAVIGRSVAPAAGAQADRMPVLAAGDTPQALLTAFLDEIVELAEREGFVPRRAEAVRVDEAELRVALSGWTAIDPAAAALPPAWEVVVVEQGGRWRARVDMTGTDAC
jgi:hypothetical protein